MMKKAIIFNSISKNQRSRRIAEEIEGDHYEIIPKKIIHNKVLQLIVYGFKTVANRPMAYEPISIDYDQYDEIVLVSPVWAGQVSAYMRQFLKDHPFINKQVTIIGSCDGGYKHYFESVKNLLDARNQVVEEIIFVKGEKA
jgi:hypothetical protein